MARRLLLGPLRERNPYEKQENNMNRTISHITLSVFLAMTAACVTEGDEFDELTDEDVGFETDNDEEDFDAASSVECALRRNVTTAQATLKADVGAKYTYDGKTVRFSSINWAFGKDGFIWVRGNNKVNVGIEFKQGNRWHAINTNGDIFGKSHIGKSESNSVRFQKSYYMGSYPVRLRFRASWDLAGPDFSKSCYKYL